VLAVLRPLALFCALSCTVPARAQPAEAAAAGEPLTISGELRSRFELLDGEFRAGGAGGDQILLFRTLVHGRLDAGPVTLGLELQDSRGYLPDFDTPVAGTNPADILQAYVEIGRAQGPEAFTLRLGRQTVGIGSERQIERRDYDNVIQTFTGAHLELWWPGGERLHLLGVVPVDQRPIGREERADNVPEFDAEQWNRRIVAVHYSRPNLLPGVLPDLTGDIFAYGLFEGDAASVPTPNRRSLWPGFRLYRRPAPGRIDLDVEGAWRFGTRRASAGAADRTDLDVSATMLIARIGYTLPVPWRPNIALQYYWASGDEDPGDGSYGQFERLFGSRRTDLNNTSIYGPLTPANLSAPGVRLELRPSDRFNARLTYSAASLASATDSWVVAGLRDPTGRSGTFIGHAFDARFRRRFGDSSLELEAGASALIFGEFPKHVPHGPDGEGTLFGYVQLAYVF